MARYSDGSATGVGWDTTGKRSSGASSAWVLLSVEAEDERMQLRYGMNPHQAARATVTSAGTPVTVRNGDPSYINLLDALNGWQLVSAASASVPGPVAASFKHVSPAGVATAGDLDATARESWELPGPVGPLTSAYVRARDADPKSSFGDMIAVSAPVDTELAAFLSRVAADGIVAPGFEPGTMQVLAAKKRGAFVVLEADPTYQPAEWERREVFGLVLEQQRDQAPLTADLLTVSHDSALTDSAVVDGLLGLATLRYTQSNSVALVKDGMTLGIGAGQQSRVDCVKLAGAKAATWWLRRHPRIRALPQVPGMARQDRLNWQIRLADGDMTPGQLAEFSRVFPAAQPAPDDSERARWIGQLDNVALASDGFLSFRDNIDHASRIGVRTVIEPGGSSRSEEVTAACAEHRITLVRTGLRLFHH
jgi:phosphoribosylaminoimidazolecarboxamide formyltransferase / IMP cyclohydrolase